MKFISVWKSCYSLQDLDLTKSKRKAQQTRAPHAVSQLKQVNAFLRTEHFQSLVVLHTYTSVKS